MKNTQLTKKQQNIGSQSWKSFRAALRRCDTVDEYGERCKWEYDARDGSLYDFFISLKDAHGFWATHREQCTGRKIRNIYKYDWQKNTPA